MLQITVNDTIKHDVDYIDDQWTLDDVAVNVDISMQPNHLVSIILNNKSYTAIVEKTDKASKEITLRINGRKYKTTIKEPIDQVLSNMGLDLKASLKAGPVKAPMPGMVLKVLVSAGQKVNKGDGLLVLEAMKMENVIKATSNCTVKSIKVAERTAVEKGAVMIELE